MISVETMVPLNFLATLEGVPASNVSDLVGYTERYTAVHDCANVFPLSVLRISSAMKFGSVQPKHTSW